ncbi:MAG: hypothetical protein R2705_18430 [Ilumatobacteraceae bacterium]
MPSTAVEVDHESALLDRGARHHSLHTDAPIPFDLGPAFGQQIQVTWSRPSSLVHERHPVALTATIHHEDTPTRSTGAATPCLKPPAAAAADHHDIEEFRWLIHGTKSADVLARTAIVHARMA